MKYCRHCGAEMDDNAEVCMKCGISEKIKPQGDKAYCRYCGRKLEEGALDAMDIRRKNAFLWRVKGEYTGFSEVLPWTDTEIAQRELGALINDVKLYGNNGIEKWMQ